jgi:hypothetical protein
MDLGTPKYLMMAELGDKVSQIQGTGERRSGRGLCHAFLSNLWHSSKVLPWQQLSLGHGMLNCGGWKWR